MAKKTSRLGVGVGVNVVTRIRKREPEREREATALTVEHLARAIRNSIDRDNMPEEEARAMAQHVMNFFGYSDRIIDNVLEPEDRDAFYMLEDSGILTTEREETTLYDGREWRIHYWMFRKERIEELLRGAKSGASFEAGTGNVYEEIPDDTWSRTESGAVAPPRPPEAEKPPEPSEEPE